MKVYDCPQGSKEWWDAREGIPTSSGASRIITPLGKARTGQMPRTYMAELIAASLGWESRFKGGPDTERGHLMEDEARRCIEFETGRAVRTVGFCESDCGRYGASPDGLFDCGTPVEIKAPDLHTFVKWSMDVDGDGNPVLPDEHVAQVHMHLLVTGARACCFFAYPSGEGANYVSNILIRVERNEITDALGKALDSFCDELDIWRRKLTGEEYAVLFGDRFGEEEAA